MPLILALLVAVNVFVFQPIKQQIERLNQPVEKPLSQQQWDELQHNLETLSSQTDHWSGVKRRIAILQEYCIPHFVQTQGDVVEPESEHQDET